MKYKYKYKYIFIILMMIVSFDLFSECKVGGVISIDKNIIHLGEPIEAKIELWNNTCINLKSLSSNMFIGKGIYLYKINQKTVSSNNAEVTILKSTVIFTEKHNSKKLKLFIDKKLLMIKLKGHFSFVSNDFKTKFYFFKLYPTKGSAMRNTFVFLFLIILFIYIRKSFFKKNNITRDINYKEMIERTNIASDFFDLYIYKNKIMDKSKTASDFFYLINILQYKEKISAAELLKLKSIKKIVLKEMV